MNLFNNKQADILDGINKELLEKLESIANIINKKEQIDHWRFMKWFLIGTFALTGATSTVILILQLAGVLVVK